VGIGGVLISQGHEPVGGNTTNVCDAWPVRRQTYGYIPSRKASPPIGWYQIILLCDRGTCVLTTCPGLHSIDSGEAGINSRPIDCKSSVLTTRPPSHTFFWRGALLLPIRFDLEQPNLVTWYGNAWQSGVHILDQPRPYPKRQGSCTPQLLGFSPTYAYILWRRTTKFRSTVAVNHPHTREKAAETAVISPLPHPCSSVYRVAQLKWSHLHFAGNIWMHR